MNTKDMNEILDYFGIELRPDKDYERYELWNNGSGDKLVTFHSKKEVHAYVYGLTDAKRLLEHLLS